MISMDLLQAIVLGIVQGATEFLPISSSGHLVLIPWLLNWSAPALVFDTMVHWGTLVAVVTYFREDLLALARAWLASLRDRTLKPDPQRRLAWLILIGGIPAGLAGLLFGSFFEDLFGRPGWTAALLLVTGLFLIASEGWSGRRTDKSIGAAVSPTSVSTGLVSVSWTISPLPTVTGALFIGLAQALAIAPGISRSGATIAAGLLVGLGRQDAARFSFLLATPIISGAGMLELLTLIESGTASTQAPALVVGFIAASVTGYLAIRFLLDYLQRHTLYIFAIYCWGLGILGLGVHWLR